MTYCLPLLTAHASVPPETVAMAHRALSRLPEPVVAALWRKKYGVFLRYAFDWDEQDSVAAYYPNTRWEQCGGYWDEDSGYAVINSKYCARSQEIMDAVVLHEFGHALSINILERPHRQQPFREAWKRGRDRVRERWPKDYAAKERMGQYCLHWTRGVQEVWAEGFAWMLGCRGGMHTAFGETFAECIDLVRADVKGLTA